MIKIDKELVKETLRILEKNCPKTFNLWVNEGQFWPIIDCIVYRGMNRNGNYRSAEVVKFFWDEMNILVKDEEETNGFIIYESEDGVDFLNSNQLNIHSNGNLVLDKGWFVICFKTRAIANRFIKENNIVAKSGATLKLNKTLPHRYYSIITKQGERIDNIYISSMDFLVPNCGIA